MRVWSWRTDIDDLKAVAVMDIRKHGSAQKSIRKSDSFCVQVILRKQQNFSLCPGYLDNAWFYVLIECNQQTKGINQHEPRRVTV